MYAGWCTPSWLVYTLLVSRYSWLVHTPDYCTLLVSTHSWLVHTPGLYTLLVSTHSWLVHTCIHTYIRTYIASWTVHMYIYKCMWLLLSISLCTVLNLFVPARVFTLLNLASTPTITVLVNASVAIRHVHVKRLSL